MRYQGLKIFLLITVFFPFLAAGQSIADSMRIESGMVLSGGEETPFWLLSNQHGNIDNNPFNGWMRASAFKAESAKKRFDYSWGLDVYGLLNRHNRFVLNQAYLSLRYAFIDFEAGKRERNYGNQDLQLSSGGILWSGNAPVIPMLVLKTNGYVGLPFTAGYLRMKAGIANGWFREDEFSSHVMLHHKYLYLSTYERWPVILSVGLQHYAQWGGVIKDSAIGALPSDLKAFVHVFTGDEGTTNSPKNEKLNALGNHLGSYNVRLDFLFGNTKTGVYWQSVFEDNSGRMLRNGLDGLWGISFRFPGKRPFPNALVAEYLNTTDQSGVIVKDSIYPSPPTGNDNYFNNYLYRSGWSTMQRTIGTPLISSPFYFNGENRELFQNNRVKGYHIGISGEINRKIDYKMLFTFSRNMGTYSHPYANPRLAQSILIYFRYMHIFHSKYNINILMAADYGEMYGRNRGIGLRISRVLY